MEVNGNEIKFYSSKCIVQKYLKYSSEEIKLNEKLKTEEIEDLHLAGGENSDEVAMGESVGIDYDKLANMIVERLTPKNIITEVDDCDDEQQKPKKVKKTSKKKTKKNDEEE
jgi:hypothetical protein